MRRSPSDLHARKRRRSRFRLSNASDSDAQLRDGAYPEADAIGCDDSRARAIRSGRPEQHAPQFKEPRARGNRVYHPEVHGTGVHEPETLAVGCEELYVPITGSEEPEPCMNDNNGIPNQPSLNGFLEDELITPAECNSDEDASVIDQNAPTTSEIVQDDAQLLPTEGCTGGGEDAVLLRIDNWRVLWGLLITNGSMKLTKTQYQAMRIIADTFRRLSAESGHMGAEYGSYPSFPQTRNDALPHYTTLYKRFKPILYNALTVRGTEHMQEMCLRKAGARAKVFATDGSPLTPVQIIPPSEYARADVACDAVFQLMRSTSLAYASSADDCIDSWPLIAARSWFYGPRRHFNVDACAGLSSYPLFAEPGDTVHIQTLGPGDFHAELAELFQINDGLSLSGRIVHVWTSHHVNRRGQPMFEEAIPPFLLERDVEIIEKLQFCSYSSPSDSFDFHVPDLPIEDEESETEATECVPQDSRQKKKRVSPRVREAIRLRNKALQERRQKIEEAWIGWKKPLLKPGDLVAIVQPAAFHGTSSSRILLVHRFWTEREERSRHVFWLRAQDSIAVTPQHSFCGFSPLTASSTAMHRDVRLVQLMETASRQRGTASHKPVSSFGRLKTGERYFIYRFLLFWDGFEITAGKSGSGEGFYMVCLNLPVQARAPAAAVRIISLTPPGVKCEAVFERILDDIITGMTTGFSDYDAEGNPVRIFLDLVGFIGDTPAINSALDVLGHTASACCHLCRYVRKSATILGSRYAGEGFHASSSATARGFYQHSGIRDSGAKEETCRVLGISPPRSSQELPLHHLQAAMFAARASVPCAIDGSPILPAVIDPYRSCLVAPDHLLTGHFRDCVNVAFRLLPTTSHRQSAEMNMMGLLRECQLPAQNRLFDFTKKSLYSMSMTELYALSVVAHFGFVRACTSLPSISSALSPRCRESISVVQSCANLIARLWNPRPAEQQNAFSISYLTSVQVRTRAHVELVRELCEMNDSKLQEIDSSRTIRARKSELEKEYRDRLLAIKTIDKPNLHRLYELVHSTLPMIGLVSRVGELVLEKAHQTLKRAIKQSNNKDVQIQSVFSAIFSDWQGRLTLQIPGALRCEPSSSLGCFRLLAGREAIFKINGKLTDVHKTMLRNALGPNTCVPALLHNQSKTVVSSRYNRDQPVSWVLASDIEIVHASSAVSTVQRNTVYCAFKDMCRLVDASPTVVFGTVVRSTFPNGVLHTVLTVGDVVLVRCRNTTNLSDHCPRVSQHTGPQERGTVVSPYHTLPWGIVALFKKETLTGDEEFWAAVNPCCVQSYVPDVHYSINSERFVFMPRVSFLVLDRTVRKAALLPACADDKCFDFSTSGAIRHASTCTPYDGSPFFLLTQEEGFPPRTG